jgi:DNA-binding CsgD family transcriptional regulator
MTGASTPCNKSDAAAMLGLLNRLHENKGGDLSRRKTLLDGLCQLVSASVALLLIGQMVSPAVQWFTIDAESPDSLMVASLDPDSDDHDPALVKLMRRCKRRRVGSVATFTRRDLIDDKAWYASSHTRNVRRNAGLDDSIYSALITAPDRFASICLSRPWGIRRRFGQREKNILDLLNPTCAWVYREATHSYEVDKLDLSPREKQTLQKLLEGRGEKEIAVEMRLSVNTVHHYVKALYKHFHVFSRAELLAKWMERQA